MSNDNQAPAPDEFLGLPFNEAKARILEMPADVVQQFAISLMIQNRGLKKYEPLLLSGASAAAPAVGGAVPVGWQPIETAPDDTLVVVGWHDGNAPDEPNPERHDFDWKEDGCWMQHHDNREHAEMVAPPGSRLPPQRAPYTHWLAVPPIPAAATSPPAPAAAAVPQPDVPAENAKLRRGDPGVYCDRKIPCCICERDGLGDGCIWLVRKTDTTALAATSPPAPAAPQAEPSEALCEDCPPVGYPTDKTRCTECPRRATGATHA